MKPPLLVWLVLSVGVLWPTVGCESSANGQTQSEEEPMMCSLSESQLAERVAGIRRLFDTHDASLEDLTVRIRLKGQPSEVRNVVESIAAKERQCCEFLRISYESAPKGGIMTVQAPAAAAHLVTPVFDLLQ